MSARFSAPATDELHVSRRGPLGRAFDTAAVAAFVLLWLAGVVALVRHVAPLEALLLVAVGLGVGHLLADLLSGLVHWFADEFFEVDTPVLGPLLIYGFRDHHRDPEEILRHGLLEVSGYNALATLPALAALLVWPAPDPGTRALHAVVLGAAFSVAATNQLHRWAHASRVPAWVGWLQRRRLVLSPEAHARHHRRGRGAYCVTAGWGNPVLDALGLLPALSVRIHRLAGRLGLRR